MQTIEKVINEVNTNAHIEKIESQMFEVITLPLQTAQPKKYEAPTKKCFGVYKKDGGRCLGVMGNLFHPTQPIELLNAVRTTAESVKDLDLSTLKFSELRGGSSMRFSFELKPLKFKNKANKNDETRFRLDFTTSFDGTQCNIIRLYTYRLICSNGMMGFGLDSEMKIRNTKRGSDKVITYLDNIAETIANVNLYRVQLKQLNDIKVTDAQIEKFVQRVFKFKQENVSTRTLNKIQTINDCIELEVKRTGKTMFGVLQGITNFTNHETHDTTAEDFNAEENIMFGRNAKINNRAQELAFAML